MWFVLFRGYILWVLLGRRVFRIGGFRVGVGFVFFWGRDVVLVLVF